jgi:hypothetical protein
MSGKHTPGPWRYDYESGYCGELIASNGKEVASFINEPDAPDARLIAAAPDLLVELHKARATLNDRLDDLIESHTNPVTGLITDDADLLAIESDQDLINSIDAAIAKATEAA